jgi:hypothetical protein
VPEESLEFDVFRDLLEEASAIGRFTRAEKSFLAAYEAFRSEDRQGFQAALKRLQLLPSCRLVCEWIGIKECLFLCFELCGPPPAQPPKVNPRMLAEAIARITLDERAVARLAKAVEKRDRAAFQRIVKAYKLEPFCHLFCHWVCVVRYRLVCRWLCGPIVKERPDLAAELRSAGEALSALLKNRSAFSAAVAAGQAGDAEKLGRAIASAELGPFCFWICEWFCSWRCVLACFTLCREFPLQKIDDQLGEAFEFARATATLAQQPAELERLSAAVGASDTKAFIAIVNELKLQRFCIQLCHWICFLRCRRFCFIVCPPVPVEPWFTHVGDFGIYADIDPGTGRTNKAQAGHGGPDYGFFYCLELRGFCPRESPTNPGEVMAYRFLYQEPGAPKPTPITGGFICQVYVTSRKVYWFDGSLKSKWQSIWIRGQNPSVPPPPGVEPDSDYFVVPDGQGWVQVIPTSPLDDAFTGGLMGFASWVPFPGSANADPAPGVPAGTAVPAGNQRNGVQPAIIFQATRVSTIAAVNGGAAPDFTNSLPKIHINNWAEVRLLDLLQFHSGGGNPCSPLTTDLDIEYTVDHEVIASFSIELVTAAPVTFTPPPPPPPPPPSTARGGAGTYHRDISSWPTCSYAVRLHTRRRLTTGLVDDSDKFLPGGEVTFCIGRR